MAGTLEIPTVGSPNSTQDPKIKSSLETLNNKLDSENKLPDTSLASPNNSAYRVLMEAQQLHCLDKAAGTYLLMNGSNSGVASGGVIFEPGVAFNPAFFYFDDADYTVAGKTQKLRVRAQIACNATKAAIKFTFGLYPITVAGEADKLTITLGTVVSGSTVEINEPAASTVSQANSGDFTIPADGAYAFGVVTSGTLTNNSATFLSAQLQTRSV